MLIRTLKRLIVMLALVGFVRATSDRLVAAPVGPSPSRLGAGSAPLDHEAVRRRRLPADEGCREPPAPTPATPSPPASCS